MIKKQNKKRKIEREMQGETHDVCCHVAIRFVSILVEFLSKIDFIAHIDSM